MMGKAEKLGVSVVGGGTVVGLLLLATGTLGAVAQRNRVPRAPRNVAVEWLQAATDSVQYEVAWGASTPTSIVQGYEVEYHRGNVVAFTRAVAASVTADTLWIPRDTVDVTWTVFVRATTIADPGPWSEGTQFVVPASIVVTAPGKPTVKIITSLPPDSLFEPDSLEFVFGRDSAGVHVVERNVEFPIAVLVWTHDAGYDMRVACLETNDGPGWVEVERTEDGSWVRPRQPGIWTPDPGCGIAVASLDPDSLTLTGPVLGPIGLLPPTRLLSVQVTLAQNGTYGVAATLTDLQGNPVPSTLMTVRVANGTWGDGSTAPRVSTTGSDGRITPGNVVAGTLLRVTADDAIPVETAAGPRPVPASVRADGA